MKRILLITHNFPPTIGGPATFMDALAAELVARSGPVTVLCSSPVADDPGDPLRPFRVRRICLANRYRYEVMVRVALVHELARHRLVFVNTLEDYFLEVNRLLRRPYILKVVGDSVWERARNLGATSLGIDEFQDDEGAQGAFAALIERRNRAAIGAERVVTPSRYLAAMVVAWGVPPERVAVIPNGVEDSFVADEAPAPRASGPLRAIFVGRITNWKGLETVLLALRELAGVSLEVVGDGPQLPSCVDLARQLGLGERVAFAGGVPRSVVRERMRKSDVLVLASLYEGLSHTLLEATALGLPSIASSAGGNSEVVEDGINGTLVPPQDVAALVRALVRLRDDEPYRHGLALRAHERGRGMRLKEFVPRYAELFGGVG
jgi:glycosyltransferase involved in cell wall biosynthesis